MFGNNLYGSFLYGENSPNYDEIRNFSPDLMKRLPIYSRKSRLIIDIESGFSTQLGRLNFSLDEASKQNFVESATYALDIYERDLGIVTEYSKPMMYRREIVKAKYSGIGTTTKQMMKNVAETFSNAEVEIIEDNPNYSFTVKFVGVRGIPENLAGLMAIIEEIKPAHLAYNFEYTYTWWEKLKVLDWNEASTRTWAKLRTY